MYLFIMFVILGGVTSYYFETNENNKAVVCIFLALLLMVSYTISKLVN